MPDASNSVLSVTIFPAVYSRLMNLDLVWMFKAIYPIFFSIMPLVLYEAFRKQVGSRKAFLAAFLIVAFVGFSTIGVSIGKQIIAELFLALLILLLVSRGMGGMTRVALLIIFVAGMVVSHYSISYVCLAFFIISLPLIYKLYAMKGAKASRILSVTFVTLFFVMAISWYMYTCGSSGFNVAVRFVQHMYVNLTEFLNPMARAQEMQVAMGLVALPSWLHEVSRVLYYLTIVFTTIGVIGVLRSIVKREETRFKYEFFSMALPAILMLAAVVVVPFFSFMLNPTRYYHIAFLILSPLCIVGGEASFRLVARLFRSPFRGGSLAPARLLVLLLLVPFFLFNYGFVYEVTGDAVPISLPLSMEKMRYSDDPWIQLQFDFEYTYEQEFVSARWLGQKKGEMVVLWMHKEVATIALFGDIVTGYSALSSYSMTYPLGVLRTPIEFGQLQYIYLNHMNVVNKIVFIGREIPGKTIRIARTAELYQLSELVPYLGNRIYANGASEIYFRDTPLEKTPLR